MKALAGCHKTGIVCNELFASVSIKTITMDQGIQQQQHGEKPHTGKNRKDVVHRINLI